MASGWRLGDAWAELKKYESNDKGVWKDIWATECDSPNGKKTDLKWVESSLFLSFMSQQEALEQLRLPFVTF